MNFLGEFFSTKFDKKLINSILIFAISRLLSEDIGKIMLKIVSETFRKPNFPVTGHCGRQIVVDLRGKNYLSRLI